MARKQVKFWLDKSKSDDLQTEALIDDLKRERLFSRAVREGLQMWVAAQQGNTPSVSTSTGNGGAGQLDEIKAMLELLVTNAKANGGYTMQSLQPTTGKQIAAPQFTMPVFDELDDAPTVMIKKNTQVDAGLNFMQSIGGIQ